MTTEKGDGRAAVGEKPPSALGAAALGAEVSRDALLCALVLAPHTFSRNRFYTLFTLPWAHRTRSRATQLRTMVRHLSAHDKWIAEVREMRPAGDGGVVLRYGVPGLSLERTAMLGPLEIAVIRFALSRRERPLPRPDDLSMVLTDDDRQRVEAALAELMPFQVGPELFQGDLDPQDDPLRATMTSGGSAMCLFCKLVQREIPAAILFEDDDVLAFSDIKPMAPTHALVVPKKHLTNLSEASPDDALLLGKLMLAASRVAREAGIDAEGYRVVVNTGANGGQTVFHLHLHVLGGRAMAWPPG